MIIRRQLIPEVYNAAIMPYHPPYWNGERIMPKILRRDKDEKLNSFSKRVDKAFDEKRNEWPYNDFWIRQRYKNKVINHYS